MASPPRPRSAAIGPGDTLRDARARVLMHQMLALRRDEGWQVGMVEADPTASG